VSERDGSKDFDFQFGSWNLTLRRLTNPLTGSTTWTEWTARSTCHPLAEGRAQAEDFSATNVADGSKIEGLTLRFYHPTTHEWSLYWVNLANPAITTPQKGKFVDGVGEFLDRDVVNGRKVIVRYLWTRTETNRPHFEQSLSTDEGRTWEVNWITDQTRVRNP
jgi:hypothetical protein